MVNKNYTLLRLKITNKPSSLGQTKYKNNNKIDSPNFLISFAVPAACLLPFFRDNFQLQLRVSQIKSQNVTTTLKMLVTLTKSKEHVGTVCNNCANKQDTYISEKSISL